MDREDKETKGFSPEESFADLLERSCAETRRLKPGEKVEARVVKISPEWIFLDLGRKGEGCLDRKEFLGADGELTVREGDSIQAYFLGAEGNDWMFTTRIGGGAAGHAQLEDAWRNGIPVEGTVDREIKGGFEIRIGAGIRGFCPYSQTGSSREEGRWTIGGEPLLFRITRYEGGGRNLVLSRRALLEEKRREERDALRESLREGMTVTGTITSIRNFGAFVAVGALEGLIPASEIGWEREEDIRKVVSVGQKIDVVVLRLDWDKERFSFSLKKTLADPWDRIEERFSAGTRRPGRVARLTPFGAFVTLEAGVDGLLHVSKLGGGKGVRHPGLEVREGQELEVMIDSVDREKRKISLSVPGEDSEEGRAETAGEYRKYLEGPPRSLGTLGDVLREKLAEKGKQ